METRWGPPEDEGKGLGWGRGDGKIRIPKVEMGHQDQQRKHREYRESTSKGDSLSVFAEKRKSHQQRITSLGQETQNTLKTKKGDK